MLRNFLPVLRQIGEVRIINDPQTEVKQYWDAAQKADTKCVLLYFSAPHNIVLDLPCPIIPVFAWEYDTIPNESWGKNKQNNWVEVLRKIGMAITHSEHSVKVIQKELGEHFPVLACPAPVEEKFVYTPDQFLRREIRKHYELPLSKEIVDSQQLKLSPPEGPKGFAKRVELTHILAQTWAHEVLEDLIPARLYRFLRGVYLFAGTTVAKTVRFLKYKKNKPSTAPDQQTATAPITKYDGIIYTSILNISDHRKNYMDMVAAFCHALGDREDATLVLKTPIMEDIYFFRQKVTGFLQSLPAFKCRVVFIGSYLDEKAYQELLRATTYYVNTSYGEGQCLPLMEFMSAGIPAVAPFATALKDYLSEDNAFLIQTGASPTCWQHDERIAIRTVHHRPDWYSLVAAYKESYEVAHTDEDRYRQMSLDAAKTLQAHASPEKTKSRLKAFLHTHVNGQVYDDLHC
ncbi:MAG: glycosyltransferase [Bacteroidota bacterium]